MKMDELFACPSFDERELVAIDKEIQAKYDEIKNKGNKSNLDLSSPDRAPQQATLKRLENLNEWASARYDGEGDQKTHKTRYNMSLRDKPSIKDGSTKL